MKAVFQDHYSIKRQELNKIIPLDMPFTLSVEPTTFCNLKCNFCLHTLTREEMIKAGHVFSSMGPDVFQSLVEQLKKFPRPLKILSFIGEGEPLLHKDLPYMIEQLSRKRLADNIQILTNGVPLTRELSSALINAGISIIKVSINGLSADDYLKNCAVKIDFDKLVSELHYLYEIKGNVQIYIKTVDAVLKDRPKEEFFKIFGDCCDKISVERVLPCIPGVSYEGIATPNVTSRYFSVTEKVKICASAFYRMSVKYDGTVKVCGCRSGIVVDKDINNFYKAWNGAVHKEIMLKVLKEEYEGITEYCKVCFNKNGFAFKEDNLDPYAQEIYERIKNLNAIGD